MKDSIRQYAQAGAGFIVSSHLLSLVEDLCTTVLILHRGRQLLHGSLAELRREITEQGRQETLEELFFRLTEAPPTPAPGDGEQPRWAEGVPQEGGAAGEAGGGPAQREGGGA